MQVPRQAVGSRALVAPGAPSCRAARLARCHAAAPPPCRPPDPQFLMARPERHIAVLSHGGMLHWALSN